MDRGAIAHWKADVGKLSTDSGALVNVPYTRASRFELEALPAGGSPEELLAAAIAGCFAMTFAERLATAGHVPYEIRAEARVMLIRPGGRWTIPAVRVHCTTNVTGVGDAELAAVAHAAREDSPIIRATRAEVTLTISRERVEDIESTRAPSPQ